MMPSLESTEPAYWFIFLDDKLLILQNGEESVLLTSPIVSPMQKMLTRYYSLGETNGIHIYCAELPSDFSPSPHFTLITLRQAFEMLGDQWHSVATKAFSIIRWDKNHHYCGHCGNTTKKLPHLFERMCEACGLIFYPRISPSVIVRIKKGDHILMARGNQFKPGIYGLIAGFVEPGETLEEALHREVKEEVGVSIKNVAYFGSQAWPFPDSLLVAFTAEYAAGEIEVNHNEIEAAGWYRYDNLPGRPSSRISIASKLIDHFIAEQAKVI